MNKYSGVDTLLVTIVSDVRELCIDIENEGLHEESLALKIADIRDAFGEMIDLLEALNEEK